MVMTDIDMRALFNEWNAALKTGDPKRVAALYDEDATLLPTISNQMCRNTDEIAQYFLQFLALKPEGRINESNTRIFGTVAIHSGVYSFNLHDNTDVQARFTFVYRWNGSRWMILEHHSSRMPEPLNV